MNCEYGYKGDCCCNCSRQIPLYKHPMNKGEGKGSITENMGFVCTAFYDMDKTEGMIFFDKLHGMCEMHNRKKNNQTYDGVRIKRFIKDEAEQILTKTNNL